MISYEIIEEIVKTGYAVHIMKDEHFKGKVYVEITGQENAYGNDYTCSAIEESLDLALKRVYKYMTDKRLL